MNYIELLNSAVDDFFPKDGKWYSSCFSRPNELNKNNLPCHLRDYVWLSKMMYADQKLYFTTVELVLNYIKLSPYFDKKRHEYELEIVRWQIDWMRSGGENWLIPDGYGDELVDFNPNIDIAFREGLINTLTKIGMDKEVIEEGLEVYAYMWRNKYMENAFNNTYNNPLNFNDDDSIIIDDEFKNTWIMKRKYDYYKNHKDVVDKYGEVEPCMKLDEESIKMINMYLDIKHKERMKELELNKDNNKSLTIKYMPLVNFD